MKLKVDLHGLVIEYEHRPMPESRFKLLCLLCAAGIYAGTVCGVAALCGGWGVVVLAVATLFSVAVFSAASYL